MGRKCFVPNCNTGYKSCHNKLSLFKSPKDEVILTKWRRSSHPQLVSEYEATWVYRRPNGSVTSIVLRIPLAEVQRKPGLNSIGSRLTVPMTDTIEQRLLTDCSWNYLKIDGDEFIIKILIEDKAPDPFYVVLFSDLISVWREDLQSAELITRNGILNPNIEAPVARLLQHINQVIINPVKSSNISFKSRTEDEITIVSQSTLSTLPYTWEFHAKKRQRQTLADHITFPLVATLAELNRRQQHLVKIISQKDAQIEDYKAEGLTLPRSGRSEQHFELTSFAREMDESKDFDDVVESSNKITFGRDLQPLFGMVSNKLLKRHQIKGDATVKSEMNSVVVDIAETTTENKLDLGSPSLELERRKQLERKLAEDKLKKLTDKPTKRLKL